MLLWQVRSIIFFDWTEIVFANSGAVFISSKTSQKSEFFLLQF